MRHLVAPLDHVLRLLVIVSLLFSAWPAQPVVAGPPAAPPGQEPEPTPAPLGTVTPVSGRPALPLPTATAVPRRPLTFEPGYELFLPLILKQGEAGTRSKALATSGDWLSKVQTDMRQAEYQVTWQAATSLADLDAAYQAPNRAHNLRTYFTPGGIRVIRRTETVPRWEWGLRLSRYGYEGAMQPAAEAQLAANGNGIEYRRQPAPGGLTEWYLNEARGLKQGFTLQTPPPAGPAGLYAWRSPCRGI